MSRPERDLYVVSIPRGQFINVTRGGSRRFLTRAQTARHIATTLGKGIKVWPETREQTDAIARGLGLGFGREPGVYVLAVGPAGGGGSGGTGASPPASEITPGVVAGQRREPLRPAGRVPGKVRKPAQSRRSARARS